MRACVRACVRECVCEFMRAWELVCSLRQCVSSGKSSSFVVSAKLYEAMSSL